MPMYIWAMNTTNNALDLKLNALSNEFRRILLGLIYTDGPIYPSGIVRHIGVESNKLAYHLNILYNANLIGREYERHGKHFTRYSIKEDGIRFLESIGALDKLKELTKQKFTPTNQPRHISPNRFGSIKHQQQHTKKLVSKRRVLAA
jgi:DNA-binding HxlR family transcriptional regulator